MTDALQQAAATPRAAAVTPRAAVVIPMSQPRTPTTPSSRRKSPLVIGNGVDQAKRVTPGQKQGPRGDGGGRSGAARSLLRGAATVVLLMLAGIAASEINLRLSRTGVSRGAGGCDSSEVALGCVNLLGGICPPPHMHGT